MNITEACPEVIAYRILARAHLFSRERRVKGGSLVICRRLRCGVLAYIDGRGNVVVKRPETGISNGIQRRQHIGWYKKTDDPMAIADDVRAAIARRECAAIPRVSEKNSYEGAPKDTKLRELGMMFYRYVGAESRARAKVTLAQIEQRSVELLREMA